ncbi:adenosine receptor A1-like [Xenia sp. Carnegie-2017]|uniref:adenosine receptor A1-like n=1 Tax=Xenia sp. Carnegie-2017 TaxID=2897299 RepID=UPI001F04CCE5|nr:adenosine receptor A1-like [Xenia sp. Carnegie-2017]
MLKATTSTEMVVSIAATNATTTNLTDANITMTTAVPDVSEEFKTASWIMCLVISLTAFTGNAALLFAVARDPLRCFKTRASSVFTISLAAFDLLTGLMYTIHYIANLSRSPFREEVGLHVAINFVHVKGQCAFLTVLALAVDRYIAVAFAVRYKKIVTRKKLILWTLLIWGYSFVFTTIVNILDQQKSNPYYVEIANYMHLASHIEIVLVLVAVAVLYAASFKSLRKHGKKLRNSCKVNVERKAQYLKSEKEFAMAILLTMIILFCTVTPHTVYMIIHLSKGLCSHCSFSLHFTRFKYLSEGIYLVLFAANPFVYAWRLPKFRSALKLSVQRRTRRSVCYERTERPESMKELSESRKIGSLSRINTIVR